MDLATQIAVAKALDASIADVAAKEFDRLSRRLSDQEIAERILRALQALDGLQNNDMPTYNAWDALFYLTWYQPRQINLAYTVVYRIPKDQNPLGGRGDLQVVDFACGALAMQFGLALAAADALEEHGSCPQIAIVSTDKSTEMRRIGRETWARFRDEVSDGTKYPELAALSHVCDLMELVDQNSLTATRWLTALHVAYRKNRYSVARSINNRVAMQKPDIVLVTSHPDFAKWAYSVEESLPYERVLEGNLKAFDLADLTFEATKCFRSGSPTEKISALASLPRREGVSSFRDYLSNDVRFNPGASSRYSVYRRTDDN